MMRCNFYAVYLGREMDIAASGRDYVWLSVSEEDMHALNAPGIVDRRILPGGPAVKVLRTAVDRLVDRSVRAKLEWVQVDVHGENEDGVLIYFLGPPAMAKQYGLDGDQYDGWWGRVPREVLTDVTVTEKDIPRERGW